MSDGEFTCIAMIATQLNELVTSETLVKGTVVHVKTFCCNTVNDRRYIFSPAYIILSEY